MRQLRLADQLDGSESNVLSLSKDRAAPANVFMYFVYILECRDGSYYVGSTQDVSQRFDVHSSGKGPAFTAKRLPVRLVIKNRLPLWKKPSAARSN